MQPSKDRLCLVAVDGLAAAGKGLLVKNLASVFGWPYLETGLIYRSLARRLLRRNSDFTDQDAIEEASMLEFDFIDEITNGGTGQTRWEMRGEAVAACASRIAALGGVRVQLTSLQRDFAESSAATHGGAILEGRDIGTKILPHAEVKFYLVASAVARARRRYLEMLDSGENTDYYSTLAYILERDERDRTRSISPLVPADDAVTIDTTALTKQEIVDRAARIIRQRCRAL